MGKFLLLIVSLLFVAQTFVVGESSCSHESSPILSKCTGCPPMYNGLMCASTTRYNDLTKGACGCGTEPNPPSYWSKSRYTAAANCVLLDSANPNLSWCPSGCGTCYRLCSTGGTTNGVPTQEGVCEDFIVENRCGDGYQQPGEAQWCRQQMSPAQCADDPNQCSAPDQTNNYGYPAHFDLQDASLQITNGLGWNNVEVTFEQIDCSTVSPPFPFSSSCQCAQDRTIVNYGGGGAPAPAPARAPAPAPARAPAPAPARAPAHASGGSACSSRYGQCGGQNYHGPTCCVSSTCLLQNAYYSQCL